jgi:hypothetical protein
VTPLRLAILSKDLPVVSFLVKKAKVNVNAADEV